MAKLILGSIILSTFAIPMLASRDPSPTRGLRRAVLFTVTFNVAYLAAMLLVYPRVL